MRKERKYRMGNTRLDPEQVTEEHWKWAERIAAGRRITPQQCLGSIVDSG